MSSQGSRRWTVGDDLNASAGRLNDPIERLDDLITEVRAMREELSRVTQYRGTLIWPFTFVQYPTGNLNYFECRRFGDASGVLVPIAKPNLHRPSITIHDGVSFTYTSDSQRTATESPDSETQHIVGAYVSGDLIIAAHVGDTGVLHDDGGVVPWIDLNCDARGWAAEPPP